MVVEVQACLFGLDNAFELGFRNIVVEGYWLNLIQLLQSSICLDSLVVFFIKKIKDILFVVNRFDFVS